MSRPSLREVQRTGGSVAVHQAFVAALMSAVMVALLALATRVAPVGVFAGAKAVALFAVTAAAGLVGSTVLGRWYLPVAAAAVGGAPLTGFLLAEISGVRAVMLLRLSAFSELRALLTPSGARLEESFFAGCMLLYGSLLAVGLLVPKRPLTEAEVAA